MRWTLGLMLILSAFLLVAPAHAQPKKEKAPIKASSRTILANLDLPVATVNFTERMKFSTFLNTINHELERQDRTVAFSVDLESYRDEGGADFPDVYEMEVHLKNLPTNTTAQNLLRQALKQLPAKSAYVIRAGRVDIVHVARTNKEYLLNQTFHADFSERRLDQALDELSELTGVSIVLDGRTKQNAQTMVSGRFHDDVALQDAVRMLTDMAELKVVYLVTGLYVTTPEHAKVMQKELREIYERPVPTNGPFMPGAGGIQAGPPPDPTMAPPESPLAPPLPPSKQRRLEAAA